MYATWVMWSNSFMATDILELLQNQWFTFLIIHNQHYLEILLFKIAWISLVIHHVQLIVVIIYAYT